jgi:hypothetical protein
MDCVSFVDRVIHRELRIDAQLKARIVGEYVMQDSMIYSARSVVIWIMKQTSGADLITLPSPKDIHVSIVNRSRRWHG